MSRPLRHAVPTGLEKKVAASPILQTCRSYGAKIPTKNVSHYLRLVVPGTLGTYILGIILAYILSIDIYQAAGKQLLKNIRLQLLRRS